VGNRSLHGVWFQSEVNAARRIGGVPCNRLSLEACILLDVDSLRSVVVYESALAAGFGNADTRVAKCKAFDVFGGNELRSSTGDLGTVVVLHRRHLTSKDCSIALSPRC